MSRNFSNVQNLMTLSSIIMKALLPFFLFFLLVAAISSCRDKTKAKSFDYLADKLEDYFVQDRRTDRFELESKSGFKGLYVAGYTTVPAAYDSLQATLADGFVVAKNNFRLLPDAVIGAESAGIVNVSVANLRSEPGHSQELATQALLGSPLEILDFQNGWYLVRTPDRYLAWLEPGAFVRMTPAQAETWLALPLYQFIPAHGVATGAPGSDAVITDLVAGNLLAKTGNAEGDYEMVGLPDGTTCWVKAMDLTAVDFTKSAPELSTDALLAAARNLAGRPYLWGGTSPKGMDCSGFTKIAYYLNGFVIPRDASQQVHAGEEVILTPDFANLLPGDELFFGSYREDGSEKITHVGFYTGNGRFLHAGADNGRIIEQSLLPESPDFAEHRLKSLLRARRLGTGSPGVVPTAEAFSRLLE